MKRLLVVGAACIALVTLGLAVASPAAAVSLNRCAVRDNGYPVLDSLTLSALSVDVSTSSKTVQVTATAHDTGGPGAALGIKSFEIGLVSPSYAQAVRVQLHLSAGSYVGSLTFPRGAEPGTWPMGVLLFDKVRNPLSYDSDELGALGDDNAVDVTSAQDTSPPTLTGFSIARRQVDTTHRPAKIHVVAHATDSESGVTKIVVEAIKKRGLGHVFSYLKPAGGDRFEGWLRIRRWVRTGRWIVSRVDVWDADRNVHYYHHKGLAGYPRSFTVTSLRDRLTPTVQSIVTQGRVDARVHADHLTMTVNATDAVSGVGSVRVVALGPGNLTVAGMLTRVAGTRQDGTWQGRLNFSFCAATHGRWKLTVDTTDRAGNEVKAKAGHVRVRARDHVVPTLTFPTGGGLATQPMQLRFNEPVLGVSTKTIAVQRELFPGQGPELAGTWACFTRNGTTTSCATGHVRSASFTPSTPFSSLETLFVTLGKEHHLGLMDLAGNPFHRDYFDYNVA